MPHFQPQNAPLFSLFSIHRTNRHSTVTVSGCHLDWVTQCSPKILVANLHPIAVFQRNAIAEAQRMGTKEVHMHVSRLAVSLELEVMVLQIGETMAHIFLSCCDRLRPDSLSS